MRQENPQKNFDPIANSPHGKHDLAYDRSGTGETHQTDPIALKLFGKREAGILDGYEMTYTGEMDAPEHEKFAQFVDSLTGKEIIVDLGSGLGSAMIHFLQRRGKAKNIISLDLDFENVKVLSDTHKAQADIPEEYEVFTPKTIDAQGDAARAPLRDSSVDVLVSQFIVADNQVNEYTKLEDIKKEIARVIKPGGVLITNEDLDYGNIVDPEKFEFMFFLNPPRAGATFYRRKEGAAKPEVLDPGYEPLEYKEGEFYTPEGKIVRPMYTIGPEEWHRRLFIEYERTFGRGHAFDITHRLTGLPVGREAQQKFYAKYGEDVRIAYDDLTSAVGYMNRGTKEQCERFIQRLREYRQKHPALYEDKPDRSKPKKKFEILE